MRENTRARPVVGSHLLPSSRKRRVPLWTKSVPFILLHLGCLGVLFTGAPIGTNIWIALAWLVGILVVAYIFAMGIYRRRIA